MGYVPVNKKTRNAKITQIALKDISAMGYTASVKKEKITSVSMNTNV